MTLKPDDNWWSFSIDPEIRANRSALTGEMEVNPPLPDKRRLLDYHAYLGLDKLLTSQVPSSAIPDERVFVITHQMFELAFKMMIFDIAVIARTMSTLLETWHGSEELYQLSSEDSDLWLPALTASARLEYAASAVLPMLLGYLHGEKDKAESSENNKAETFNSIEFYRFRDNLVPASGFQSAQFRLIQRALGKARLFDVRLFPGDEYWRQYEDTEGGPVAIVDPLVLRDDAKIASPESDSPLAQVANLDDVAQEVVARLPRLDAEFEARYQLPPIPLISETEVESVVASLKGILKSHREKQAKGGRLPADAAQRAEMSLEMLRSDLLHVMEQENARRQSLMPLVSAVKNLQLNASTSPLATVLRRLITVDRKLHDKSDPSNFLASHMQMATTHITALEEYAQRSGHIDPPSGTGGGGIPYLAYMRQLLIPLFPALIFCRPALDQPTTKADLLDP